MSRAERRQNLRARFSVPIKYRLAGQFTALWLDGILTDLGAGGLRFTSHEPIESGTYLELGIALPQETYLLSAKAIWEKEVPAGLEHGAEFVNVTTDQQVKIDALVHFLSQGTSSSQ